MKKYGVKEVSKISGVSVRTLHYYDEIGLLKPLERTDAGYRYYGELLRLQQAIAKHYTLHYSGLAYCHSFCLFGV